jgi:hypothetical protein
MVTKLLMVLPILIFGFNDIRAQEFDSDYQEFVSNFIECIKMDKREEVADMISYPLERGYPIPDVNNAQEFLTRYDEIFDDSLKQIIINSSIATDWSVVGWRGISLTGGLIWLDSDRLIAVNYQSEFERNMMYELIANDKHNIHSSLRQFYRPVHILKTSTFRIRIDDLGSDIFRYASWPIDSPMSNEPDLVLNNGQCIWDGSGGNHSYLFTNGDYTYECFIIEMGDGNSPPAILKMYENDIEILAQDAIIIRP